MKIFYLFFFIIMIKCTSGLEIIKQCNEDNALIKAKKIFKKAGVKYDSLFISRNDSLYVINAFNKKIINWGSAGVIKISAKTCQVIEKKFYQ